MDFEDTPEEARFRQEVQDWLKANARPKSASAGSGEAEKETERDFLQRAKKWQARKADAGYAQITWPEEYGCRGGTPIQQVIYNQEESKYDAPGGPFGIGLGMCIPTMMAYATQDQLKRYVGPAIRGEEIWCQLFSEPAAGSDVAALRTKAEKDGDEWVVNGQKVWTSGAHYSDYGILLTRTDPDAPKHKGLTMFFLDMKSPGIEVRPIRQASGASNFNEVFFTDVRIPDSQRLGEVGKGWHVALTTLMNERMSIGGNSYGVDFDEFMALARSIELEDGPAIKNSGVRDKMADWFVQSRGLRYTNYRSLTALSKGQTPGPEASIGKVVLAPKLQDLTSYAMDLEDMGGIMMGADDAPQDAVFQDGFMWAPGIRIAGGTDEILRNIIAERVLGLPQEVRVDKDVAFKDLPKGR